jgi:hypothetical protein
LKQNNRKSKAAEYTIFEELELLQQYFSVNAQYFSLTTNQYKHHHKPNFGEMNRATNQYKHQHKPNFSETNRAGPDDAYADLL